jgi:CMP-N-acetylneuraminic acid synthetase
MIRGQQLTAIIPVRGGSKGIPRKNLKRLGRDTLLERAIKLARYSPWVDRILVTTDDPEMHQIARNYGVAAPELRPAHLASDSATTVDVVAYLIEQAEISSGYLLLLQVSSPLRTADDLATLCTTFENADADAIVSLCRHEEPHPAKLKVIKEGQVRPFLETGYEGPRQDLTNVYALNGAFYLVDKDVFLTTKSFLPPRTIHFPMPPERSANLDTMTDWQIVKALVEKRIWKLEELDITVPRESN